MTAHLPMSSPVARGILHAVRIETDPGFADLVELGLEAAGIGMTLTHDVEARRATFQACFPTAAEAEALRAGLAPLLAAWAEGEPWSLTVTPLANEDWQNSWKRHFKTERISERLVIKPSWETFTAVPGDCVIEIDPGMSFGTGRHFTTRSCLQQLDRLSRERPGASLCDVGCGSGILAIGAALLGFGPIWAFDYDPDAVAIACENSERNGMAGRITCTVADLSAMPTHGTHDVVCANLLAVEHERFHAAIAPLVAPGGLLIIGGTMHPQYAPTLALYAAAGFSEVTQQQDAEWTTAVLRRKETP